MQIISERANISAHISNTENSKGSTKKLSEIVSEFSKVAGYKVNIQKSMSCFYTNELSESEAKKKKKHYSNKKNKVPRNKFN